MAALGKYMRTVASGLASYRCPACGVSHVINIDPAFGQPCWTLIDIETAPTVTPSVRVNAGNARLCHHFIRAGKIEYLSDCSHVMAGQTVPMVEINDDLETE